MPDPTAPDIVTTAPAAPTPAPQPDPTPAAEPRHPGLSSLLDALADTVEEPEKPKEVTKPKADPKPPAPAAAEPVVADKPIKVTKKPLPQRPALPIDPPAPAPTPTPAASTPPADNGKWREGLLENEKDMLADAEFAEKKFPERHKGLVAKTEKFLREHAAMVEAPDFSTESPAYRAFLDKNKPALAERDLREIISARAADKAREELAPEISSVREELFRNQAEPIIQRRGNEINSRLANEALPEELMNAYKAAGGGAKGVEALKAEFPLEFEITDAVVGMATGDLQEFMRITHTNPATGRSLSKIASDPSDPKFEQHQRLGKMVGELCEEFKKSAPTSEQKRGEKWFVTRDEWNQIPAGQRGNYWTFTNEELIERGQRQVPKAVAEVIRQERARMESKGYVRAQKKTPMPAVPPAVPPGPSAPNPSPRPSPVPGANPTPAASGSATARNLASQLAQG